MNQLSGTSALVTGASGAIGGAIATALAARGVRLLLSGRDAERLEALAARLAGAAPEVVCFPADLAEEGSARALVERLEAAFGGLDLLVHALGAYAAGTVAETPVAELDRQLRVNARVPYLLTRLTLPWLTARRGQIVFVNSSAALRPGARVGPYAASKAALKALADALRAEVNPAAVRVLSVFPGRTASAMQEEVHRLEGKPYRPELLLQPADVAASIVHALELPRTAEVTDLHIRPMRPG